MTRQDYAKFNDKISLPGEDRFNNSYYDWVMWLVFFLCGVVI